MKEIIWDDNYAIGVEEIDRQHMDFVRLVRRFNIGIQKGIPMAVQLRILQELLKYAEYHFTSEENIMLFTKYPDLTSQQSEHSKLLNSLERRIDSYKRAPDHGEQLSDFLYEWFVNHTQVEDRKIADYLRQSEIAHP
jgi:hemerythrin-like metal-binding protein